MSTHNEPIPSQVYNPRVLRRLLSYIRPYRGAVGLAILVTLAGSALSIIPPYLMKVAIDRYIAARDLGGLVGLAALYAGILIGEFAFGYANTWLLDMTGQKIMRDIRVDLFRHVQRLDVAQFDRSPIGQLMTRMTSDVEVLNELFAASVITVFADIASLFGIVVILTLMSLELELVTLSVLPLLFLLTFVFKITARKSFERIRMAEGHINAFLQENISGSAVVQLFARERKQYERFTRINRKHLHANEELTVYYAAYYPLLEVIGVLALALVVWYGGLRVASGAMTVGVLIAFIQYANITFHPILGLSEKYATLQSVVVASERIFGLLDDEPSIISPSRPIGHSVQQGGVEFRNVSFAYRPGEPMLKRISFKVVPGERLAIVGATGAGKSTIINLLMRFYDPADGAVLIDGIDVRQYDLAQMRRSIAIVLQDVFLFSGTVADNLRLGNPALSNDEVERLAETMNCGGFISQLANGYQTRLGERGAGLSAGQRQLLAFARAFAMNPKIIILDEATSALDAETERQVQCALEKLLAGRTSIVIAHRLSTIRNADRIIVLHRGRIREIGSHQELLLLRGIYWRLYNLYYRN